MVLLLVKAMVLLLVKINQKSVISMLNIDEYNSHTFRPQKKSG
jgi:hypothetical protein